MCKYTLNIISVPETTFKLQNSKHNQCLKTESPTGKFIIGTNCESSTHDMQWMWINSAKNKQLMNMRTLKCMKEAGSDGGNITMTQCQNTPGSREIVCNDLRSSRQSRIRWQTCRSGFCLNWRYLLLSDTLSWGLRYAISKWAFWSERQSWNTKSQSVCGISTDYQGIRPVGTGGAGGAAAPPPIIC